MNRGLDGRTLAFRRLLDQFSPPTIGLLGDVKHVGVPFGPSGARGHGHDGHKMGPVGEGIRIRQGLQVQDQAAFDVGQIFAETRLESSHVVRQDARRHTRPGTSSGPKRLACRMHS